MAKMFPSSIERKDPRRKGEYKVYDWFSDDSIPGYCFYSLPQEYHKHKLIGEVDFLYICEKGMLCVEVKGGKEVYRVDRQWYSKNQKDEINMIHDPFEQSRGCMFALGKLLEKTYGKFSTEHKLQRASCVIFPDCISKCKGDDISLDIMFDNRYELSDFKDFLYRSIQYWADKEIEKHFGNGSNPLSDKQVKQMVDLLRADFGSVPSLKLEIQDAEKQILQLSEEQLDIIDDMSENKHVLVQGGAGTGKSLLAIEKAANSLAKNKRVLYVCYNRNMVQYAKINLPDDDNLTIKTFHSLLGSYIGEDSYKVTRKELCKKFEKSQKDPEKYDVLVIDEGQDLMADYIWEAMDKFLVKGLEKGEWIIFTDPNQSIFTEEAEYEDGMEYLKELYSPNIYSLRKNWRNTAQIGRRTSRLTFVPPAKHMKINGPNVVVQKVNGSKELIKILKSDIYSLLMGGTPSKDIVILSTYKLENSVLCGISNMCNMKLHENKTLYDQKNSHLNYYTVQSFKGLESSVILYIDIPGFKSLQNRQMNYVAMTRARAMLYLYVDSNIMEEYDYMMDESC